MEPEPTPTDEVELIPPAAGEVVYENCEAAIAAGAAPILAGQAGYSLDLDGDANGVACDSYVAPEPTQPPAAGDAGPATLPQTGSEDTAPALFVLALSLLLLGLIVYGVNRNKKNGPRL